jgi:hypothetical protein
VGVEPSNGEIDVAAEFGAERACNDMAELKIDRMVRPDQRSR